MSPAERETAALEDVAPPRRAEDDYEPVADGRCERCGCAGKADEPLLLHRYGSGEVPLCFDCLTLLWSEYSDQWDEEADDWVRQHLRLLPGAVLSEDEPECARRHGCTNYDQLCRVLSRHDPLHRAYYRALYTRANELVTPPDDPLDDQPR